jgi:Ca2+/Na+ antiporter
MVDDALYEERVSSARTQALFWSLAAVCLILFVWRMSTTGWNTVALALLLVFLFFLFYSLNYRTLLIRLTRDSLDLRFGVFTWTVPLESIDECRLDDLPLLLRYGGAGVHFMVVHKRYRVSFNLLEYPRIVVALRSQRLVRDVSFTTRRPAEMINLLKAARSAASAA